jgi:hypothetical protein
MNSFRSAKKRIEVTVGESVRIICELQVGATEQRRSDSRIAEFCEKAARLATLNGRLAKG